jgi:hypothetical protein
MRCPTCLTNNPVTRKLVTRQHHYAKYGRALFWAAMLLGAILLFGCSSGDGGGSSFVPPVPPTDGGGGNGPEEIPPAPEATIQTCSLCHAEGKLIPISVAHPDPTGKDVTLEVTNLTNTGGVAQVTFNARTDTGPVTDLTLDDVRFMIATLVPAGTQTGGYPDTPGGTWGTWDTSYFERWAYERSGTDREGIPYPNGVFDASDAANGNYIYTFDTAFGSPEALAEAPDYNAADTQRLVITVSGRDNPVTGFAITNNSVGFLDFVTPSGGGPVTTLVSQRQFVTADACKQCHGPQFENAAHAGTYLDTRACIVCHSPLGHYGTLMQEDDAYLPVLTHQIHAAIDNPAFPDRINGMGYSAVTYPQEIADCVVCHNNDSGQAQGTGNEVDNWKTEPAADTCGSCHTDVDFTTGANHAGGPQDNNDGCTFCHKPTGAPNPPVGANVTDSHDTAPDAVYHPEPENIPEFDVTLTITPEPANGTYYTAGEAPEVRVTLTNHADGSPVGPAVYTTPEDDAGQPGGGLTVAELYVYGPRARALPVLATDSTTDPNWDGNPYALVDDHLLFAGGADPQVTTNSSGFGYQLLPIPSDLAQGTYMVRVLVADYGRVESGNYRIDSTAFKNIQIGTEIVEAKVAGNPPLEPDAFPESSTCVDCHGDGTAPFHDERHSVVFDTDQCLSCHWAPNPDPSYGVRFHGDPLANRVHAVHSANAQGDILVFSEGRPPSSRDWTPVTYPQNNLSPVTHTEDDGLPNCVTCHASGDTTYKTLPYMNPCSGCHVDPTDDLPLVHMNQNGGPWLPFPG